MINLTESVLSLQELWMLIRLAGIEPQPGSPLADISPQVQSIAGEEEAILAALRAKGLTDGDDRVGGSWRPVLDVLGAPAAWMWLSLVNAHGSLFGHYLSSGDTVVSWTTDPQGRRIAFPHRLDDLFQGIAAWMETANVQALQSFRAAFTIAEVAALAALTDASRQEQLEALLERRRPLGERFRRADLHDQIALGVQKRDRRWLSGVIAAHTVFPLVDAECDKGLAQLQARNAVRIEDGEIVLLPPLSALCEGLANTVPNLALHTKSPQGKLVAMLCIRGTNGYWVMEQTESTPDAVRMMTMSGGEFEKGLKTQLGMLFGPAPTQTRCQGCGRLLQPDSRFCPHCGTRIADQDRAAARAASGAKPPSATST